MSSVTNFIAEVDLWAWHQAEKLAENSPNIARVTLVIPIAIGTIVRDLLANPAKCVEEIIRLPSSEGKIHNVIRYLGLSVFSPITALIDAIFSVVVFLQDPYHASRCNELENFKTLIGKKELVASLANQFCVEENITDDQDIDYAKDDFSSKLDELSKKLLTNSPRGSVEREAFTAEMKLVYTTSEDRQILKAKIENRLKIDPENPTFTLKNGQTIMLDSGQNVLDAFKDIFNTDETQDSGLKY